MKQFVGMSEIKCECCGAEGTGEIKEFQRIDCPNCGAGYIPWFPPGSTEIQLRCVVRPIFQDVEFKTRKGKG